MGFKGKHSHPSVYVGRRGQNIMKVNKKQQITDFIEKPKDKETVAPFRMQSKKNGVAGTSWPSLY